MRIGVYGDSFAESYPATKHFAWFNQLPKFIPGAKVKSYGKGGSSVFYSYTQFLQTHLSFDFIIFLVTDPNRYTKSMMIDGDHVLPHSLSEVEHLLKTKNVSSTEQEILESLKTYFIELMDEDYNTQMTELMLTHIERVNPNIIFFPCFPNSFLKSRIAKAGLPVTGNTLGHIAKKQSDILGIYDLGNYQENTNAISCHFTEEFNLGVAELFATKIKHDIWNWKAINRIKLEHDKNYYYNGRR